jgi:DHA1 family multidrug resistance protein-like MFS transporter
VRNRAFIVLALSVFSSTLGIGMVSPILPVVAKELGATGAWLGLSFSAFAVSQGASTLLFGRLSDRWGRRPFIYCGFIVYGLSAVGYATATNFEQIIAFRFIAGFGTAAVFPIAMAYIGDMAEKGREGTWMGTFNVANFVGFGAGPLIGGLIRDGVGADAAFWTMGGILFGTAIVVFLLLPARPPVTAADRRLRDPLGPDPSGQDLTPRPSAPIIRILRDRTVRGMMVFSWADNVAFGAAFGFLAVYMDEKLGASAVMIGVVLAARTWINGLMAPIFGRAADRFDRVRLASVGLAVGAVASFFVPDTTTVLALGVLFVITGLSEGVAWPAISAMTVDKGRVYGMGGLMGLRETAMAGGLLFGSVGGGLLATEFGLGIVFRMSSVAMMTGALAFLWLARDYVAVSEDAPPRDPASDLEQAALASLDGEDSEA